MGKIVVVVSSSCSMYLLLTYFMKAGFYILGQIQHKLLLGVLNMHVELASVTYSAKMTIIFLCQTCHC